MNYLPQFAVMTFLLMAVTCFIAFDVLGPVDKTSKDVLPGARIVSAVSIFVGVWSAQVIGLMSVHSFVELKLELLPLVSSFGAGLLLACLGIAVRTQLDRSNAHNNTPVKRLLGLLPFVVATVLSGESLKHASRLDFSVVTTPTLTVSAYATFFVGVLLAGLLVDRARNCKGPLHSTVVRGLAALALALAMLASQSLFFKGISPPPLKFGGYSMSAIAMSDIGVTLVGAIMSVIATWLLVKLLQGRLDARIRESSEALQKMSDTDSLTGLPNRRCFHTALEQAVAESPKGPIALFFMDLDGFKPINDGYGHAVGDQVLKVIAARLRSVAGKATIVARLGGDEFVILFAGATTKETLDQQALALISAVAAPINVGQHELGVTTSVGIALFPTDAGADKLMGCADAAMYRAKHTGKNHHRFYSPAMDDGSSEMVEVQREMKTAFENQEFELRLCPQFRPLDGSLAGVEALIYWNHPTKGLLAPEAFLDDAQRMGMGQKFVKWTLQEVAKVQHRLGDTACNTRISVNFGSLHLKQHQFLGLVRLALTESGLQSRNLCFEIREILVPTAVESTESLVHTLRSLGIETSLDEYGRGSVSVSALRRIGFTRVRIAAEYVDEAVAGAPAGAVLGALVALVKSLGLSAALRGVATDDQLKLANAVGADEVQGSALALPLTLAELTASVPPAHSIRLPSMLAPYAATKAQFPKCSTL